MIILYGIKHCGKSTIGKMISEKYNLPFVDVDEEIEKIEKKSCREIYQNCGKEAFMKAEATACEKLVENPELKNAVIATGGGICDNQKAIELLSGEQSFYIDVEEEIAFKRICKNKEKTGSWPGWISKEIYEDLEKIKNVFHEFYLKRTEEYKKLCSQIIYVKNGNSKEAVTFFENLLKK